MGRWLLGLILVGAFSAPAQGDCGNAVFARQAQAKQEAKAGGDALARSLIGRLQSTQEVRARWDLVRTLGWNASATALDFLIDGIGHKERWGEQEYRALFLALGDSDRTEAVRPLIDMVVGGERIYSGLAFSALRRLMVEEGEAREAVRRSGCELYERCEDGNRAAMDRILWAVARADGVEALVCRGSLTDSDARDELAPTSRDLP